MNVLTMPKRADQSKILNGFLLASIADIIRDPQGKKELVDILNKHIEYQHRDSMPRLKYSIDRFDLATKVNDFISMNHQSFNQDLAILINRFINKNHSNADGNAIVNLGKSLSNADGAIQSISSDASKSKVAAENNDDAIKVSLINKGIDKKTMFPVWIKLLIAVAIIAGIVYLLIKFKKVEVSNSGETEVNI